MTCNHTHTHTRSHTHTQRYNILKVFWKHPGFGLIINGPPSHLLYSWASHQSAHTPALTSTHTHTHPHTHPHRYNILKVFWKHPGTGLTANDFLSLDQYKNVNAWWERIAARPAVKRGLTVRVNGVGKSVGHGVGARAVS